jgi:hypothetical protein
MQLYPLRHIPSAIVPAHPCAKTRDEDHGSPAERSGDGKGKNVLRLVLSTEDVRADQAGGVTKGDYKCDEDSTLTLVGSVVRCPTADEHRGSEAL